VTIEFFVPLIPEILKYAKGEKITGMAQDEAGKRGELFHGQEDCTGQ
jgi:hypothetical protein